MTMTRTPAGTSAGHGPDPGPGHRGPGIAGFTVRLTAGGYLLMIAALLVSGLSLPVAAPGRPTAAYLAAATAVALLFLVSLVLHELAHSVAARRHGVRVSQITVGFLGGTRHGWYDLPGPRAQWRVAAAGPAASLVLAGLCAAAAAGLSVLAVGRLTVLALTAAAWLNVLLGVFSVLPGAGPDGGRIVRALTWARTGDPARAGLVAARAGQITGAIVAAGGLAALLLGHPAGVWIGLIGVLAITTSRAQARRLRTEAALSGLRVRDIVPRPGPAAAVAQAWQTVQAFLDGEGNGPQPELAGAPTAVPIRDFNGRPAGILTLSQLAAVPPDRRDTVRLSDVATPLAQVITTSLDEPMQHLLGRLSVRPASPAALHTAGHALVLHGDGSAVGVLTPADFARASQLGALRTGRGKAAGG